RNALLLFGSGTLRRSKPAVEIGQRAGGHGALPGGTALLALDAGAGRVVRGRFEWREQAEVDVHRLEGPWSIAGSSSVDGEMAAGDVAEEGAEGCGRGRWGPGRAEALGGSRTAREQTDGRALDVAL